MRAPISIVIPTLNAAADLPGCLAALVEGIDLGLVRELVISDGGSTDETLTLAEAWGAEIVTSPASRGGQLRAGCAQAKGEWLLVLHADTQLAAGWTAPVRAHLASQKAGWFRLRFDRGGRVVAAWANVRAYLGLPYGDQGMLLPRRLYERVGGYADIPLMEDVKLAQALKGHMTPIKADAVTSAVKYRAQGWLRHGTRNNWLLAQYFAGASPERLAAAYRR